MDQIWLFSHQFGVGFWLKVWLQKSHTPPAPPQRWRRWLKRMKRDDFVGKLHKAGAVSESTAKHGAFWQFCMLVKERQSWLGISQQQKWHIQAMCHIICMKWFETYRLKQSIQLSWSYKHFCKSLVLSLCRFSSPVCVTCFLEMLQRCYEGYLFHRNHLNSSGRSFWTKTGPRLAFFSDFADNKCLKKLAFWIVWWVHLDVHSFFSQLQQRFVS